MKALKTKTKYLGLMSVAAMLLLGLGSCSNDETVNDKGDAKNLLIKLPANVVLGTRAVEDPVADQETTTLDNIRVYLLIGSTVFKTEEFTAAEITAQQKHMELVPVAVDNVILLANVPTGIDVSGLTTDAGIRNFPFTIISQSGTGIDEKTLIGEGVPATATPNPADGHDYKEVNITLNALTARMEVGTVIPGTGIASVELIGVWINNFYADGSKVDVTYNNSAATCWDISPLTSTSPSITDFSGNVTVTNAYSPAAYFDDGDAAVDLTGSQVYAYHVFAGTNIPHLVLLVCGEYEAGNYENGEKYFMGWVTFTKFLDGGTAIPSMNANYIYKIGVTGGITINPEDITPDPEMLFDLGINVTIAPWTAKDVTPSLY